MKQKLIPSLITLLIYTTIFVIYLFIDRYFSQQKELKKEYQHKIELKRVVKIEEKREKVANKKIVKGTELKKAKKTVNKIEPKSVKKVVKKSVNKNKKVVKKKVKKEYKKNKVVKKEKILEKMVEKIVNKEQKKSINDLNISIKKESLEVKKVTKEDSKRDVMGADELLIPIFKESNTKKLNKYVDKNDLKILSSLKLKKSHKLFQPLYELYEDFDSLDGVQREFILNNLSNIGYITQRNLNLRGYPKEAIQLGLKGRSVLEFYLYPNGDISKIRVVKSNSSILDENGVETIKASFKDYPRPKKKTLIRILIRYILD